MCRNEFSDESNLQRKQKLLISDKLNVTIDEAVELMSIGRVTLNKLAEAGYIRSFFVGTKRCFPRWALEEFTRNVIFKRIDLQTLEITDVANDYDKLIQRLTQENQEMKNKLDIAKKALY
ncbi:MAG: excisionase family DNA-binding protein [Turicibacter sp.]|nr:excisionase family DNA-binding protein [Turicibacter sp.]